MSGYKQMEKTLIQGWEKPETRRIQTAGTTDSEVELDMYTTQKGLI